MSNNRWIAFALSIGLAVAGALFLWGWSHRASTSDIGIEVAKTGLQLGVIVILGGAVTGALKLLESARDHRRRLNDYRIGALRTVVTSYNEIKAVRRLLRAHGFRSPTQPVITREQASLFHELLARLNREQLALEALYREVTYHRDMFTCSSIIENALRTVEQYVNGVIKNWEDDGSKVVEGASSSVIGSMSRLQAFLDRPCAGFDVGAANPMETLGREIGSQLLSASDSAPSTVSRT